VAEPTGDDEPKLSSAKADPTTDIPETPFCGDLRSKRYFLFESLPTDAAEFLDPSGYCWCYHTQLPVGPDGQSAEPDLCRPGRSCYRSALAPET
jgi:hypothetical protein